MWAEKNNRANKFFPLKSLEGHTRKLQKDRLILPRIL